MYFYYVKILIEETKNKKKRKNRFKETVLYASLNSFYVFLILYKN